PPQFTCHEAGSGPGNGPGENGEDMPFHAVDSAIRVQYGTDFRVRCDLAATVFLDEPDSYEGGDLVIEHAFGTQRLKLPAGHMLLYPASDPHGIAPVIDGRGLTAA